MAGNRTPKWHISVAVRTGEAAARLADKHRQVLEPRLAPGLIDGLISNTGLLRAAMMGQRAAYSEKEGATVSQDQAAKRGQRLSMAIREAVKRGAASDQALQKDIGVGKRVDENKVSSVEAALASIAQAATQKGERLLAAGVLPADIEKVKSYLAVLSTADRDQEGLKATSKMSTRDRDRIQVSVEEAIDSLVGTGGLAFLENPKTAELFADLVPSKSDRKKPVEIGERKGLEEK